MRESGGTLAVSRWRQLRSATFSLSFARRRPRGAFAIVVFPPVFTAVDTRISSDQE